jgi:hypothetical protein
MEKTPGGLVGAEGSTTVYARTRLKLSKKSDGRKKQLGGTP